MPGMYEYYLEGVKIGVYAPNNMRENILMLENTLENELSSQIRDEINSIDKSEIQKEAEETKQVEDYARKIGVNKVKNIHSIEIPRKEDDEKETDVNKDEKVKQEAAKASEVNIKQSIELSERANDLYDFKKWLGGNIPPEFTKVVVIDSEDISQMKDENGKSYKRNSTRYDLALLDKNNNVEPLRKYIPQLQQRNASGNNPIEQKYQIDKDGKVERDAILSEYEIGEKIVQIDSKELGRVELNIGKEEHTGKETLGTQVRDSNAVYAVDTDVRRVMGEYERNGVRNVDANLEEIKKHDECKKSNEKEHTYEDIDGDESSVSHGYMTEDYVVDENGNKFTYDELATRWGNYDNGKPDAEAVKEWFEKQKQENSEMTIEEIIEKGDEEHEDPRAPEYLI